MCTFLQRHPTDSDEDNDLARVETDRMEPRRDILVQRTHVIFSQGTAGH